MRYTNFYALIYIMDIQWHCQVGYQCTHNIVDKCSLHGTTDRLTHRKDMLEYVVTEASPCRGGVYGFTSTQLMQFRAMCMYYSAPMTKLSSIVMQCLHMQHTWLNYPLYTCSTVADGVHYKTQLTSYFVPICVCILECSFQNCFGTLCILLWQLSCETPNLIATATWSKCSDACLPQ